MSMKLGIQFSRLRLLHPHRFQSTFPNQSALDLWIANRKQLVLADTLHTEHLSDLYITLPTRDGTRQAFETPKIGGPLGFGHHLAFFHPRTPEIKLRPDGTDADFCPPEPFVRRMWAGGRIEWRKPLVIGGKATSVSTIGSVEKKGFSEGKPMVFVKQQIEVQNEGEEEVAITEERTHVYLALGLEQRKVREVKLALPEPDFSFTYTPSATTLFRFSALTFNGHHIHLDRDYAQKAEGYPERLVHGPLTALMLLETLLYRHPEVQPKVFEYRALNPVIVNRAVTIYGAWTGTPEESPVDLWTSDEAGVIGMRGTVSF